MSAVLVSTAVAVLTALTDGEFSQEFTPVRSYADWELPLKKVTKLLCDVVPVSKPTTDLDDNASIKFQPAVDIVFRQRFSVDDQDTDTGKVDLPNIDALVQLVEEVHDFFCMSRLDDYDDAACEVPQILMAYSPSHLRQYRQFTGIVRVPFTVNHDV